MGRTGLFQPSNIVFNKADGYYYFLAERFIKNGTGAVSAFRTKTLADPTSWRAWNGTDFTLKMLNPYTNVTADTAAQTSAALPQDSVSFLPSESSLSYSSFFKKWICVYTVFHKLKGPGFYYALSDDIVHWGPPRLLMNLRLNFSGTDGIVAGPTQSYPSLIDQNDTTRNFETIGQTAQVYYTRFNSQSMDRDLMRVPVRFLGSAAKVGTRLFRASYKTGSGIRKAVFINGGSSGNAAGCCLSDCSIAVYSVSGKLICRIPYSKFNHVGKEFFTGEGHVPTGMYLFKPE